ncbi:MAG TPA: Crp/Fnr family transcriptional regulator [Puia sp.]
MYEPLFTHIARYVRLEESEREILISTLIHKKVPKKELLLKQGQICPGNFFVLSGCLRLYSITKNGTEQILQFAIPGWWLSDYQSFENNIPSEYYIQAVENSELAIIPRSARNELFQKIPLLNNYFRILMQRAYAASLKKMEIILSTTAEERYTQFINDFPEFAQRVPQYMLASFLGFTPEFLSMLRAKNKQ